MRFVLERGTSWKARAVEWWSDGEYSHAALLFEDGMVIEAHPRYGVRCVPFGEAFPSGSDYDVFAVTLTRAQEDGTRAFAEAQVGKPYDWWGDWRLVTRGHYDDEPDEKWFCSEVVFESPKRGGGVELLARTQGCEVTPVLLKRSPLAVKLAR